MTGRGAGMTGKNAGMISLREIPRRGTGRGAGMTGRGVRMTRNGRGYNVSY